MSEKRSSTNDALLSVQALDELCDKYLKALCDVATEHKYHELTDLGSDEWTEGLLSAIAKTYRNEAYNLKPIEALKGIARLVNYPSEPHSITPTWLSGLFNTIETMCKENDRVGEEHGILANICDLVFDDEERAAVHGYKGVVERTQRLVDRNSTLEEFLKSIAELVYGKGETDNILPGAVIERTKEIVQRNAELEERVGDLEDALNDIADALWNNKSVPDAWDTDDAIVEIKSLKKRNAELEESNDGDSKDMAYLRNKISERDHLIFPKEKRHNYNLVDVANALSDIAGEKQSLEMMNESHQKGIKRISEALFGDTKVATRGWDDAVEAIEDLKRSNKSLFRERESICRQLHGCEITDLPQPKGFIDLSDDVRTEISRLSEYLEQIRRLAFSDSADLDTTDINNIESITGAIRRRFHQAREWERELREKNEEMEKWEREPSKFRDALFEVSRLVYTDEKDFATEPDDIVNKTKEVVVQWLNGIQRIHEKDKQIEDLLTFRDAYCNTILLIPSAVDAILRERGMAVNRERRRELIEKARDILMPDDPPEADIPSEEPISTTMIRQTPPNPPVIRICANCGKQFGCKMRDIEEPGMQHCKACRDEEFRPDCSNNRITRRQAADIVGISVSTIRRLEKSGELPFATDDNGVHLFSIGDIQNYMKRKNKLFHSESDWRRAKNFDEKLEDHRKVLRKLVRLAIRTGPVDGLPIPEEDKISREDLEITRDP